MMQEMMVMHARDDAHAIHHQQSQGAADSYFVVHSIWHYLLYFALCLVAKTYFEIESVTRAAAPLPLHQHLFSRYLSVQTVNRKAFCILDPPHT
jgi:hypothetical protein